MMQRDLHVTVDSWLHLDDRELSDKAMRMLHRALTVTDPDTGEQTYLAKQDASGRLLIPRGFALRLSEGLATLGWNVVFDDQRASVPVTQSLHRNGASPDFSPRPYQSRAIDRMLSVEQGIYEAPSGAGKTIACAHLVDRIQQRTIVLVDKIHIAQQWADRINDAIGCQVGIIGDNGWNELDITVALRQTLWSRYEALQSAKWFDTWGAVILDEAHGISAPTVQALINSFPAKYRIGVSATPDRWSWMQMISRSIIGEILCRTTGDELEAAGVLVRPKTIAIRTPFQYRWGRRRNTNAEWMSLVRALKSDPGRNRLIGKVMGAQRGHSCLVHTEHLDHVDELAGQALAHGWPDDSVLLLTGRQSAEDRIAVRARADDGDCIIFSTIGQEALDIPRLDRFFIVYPTKSTAMVTQMVGRIKRVHDDKALPIVYDFYDSNVGVLRNQFDKRRGVYTSEGMALSII